MAFRLALLVVLIAQAAGIALWSPLHAQKTTNRIRWFKSVPYDLNPDGIVANRQAQLVSKFCTNRQACSSLDVTDPVQKRSQTFVETFRPLQDYVLVGFDQDDVGAGVNGNTEAADRKTGIVVSIGPDVHSTLLTEGARVYLGQTCLQTWTAASWQNWVGVPGSAANLVPGLLGPAACAAGTANCVGGMLTSSKMVGKLMNGVDLNNGNGWGYGYPGTLTNAAVPDPAGLQFPFSPASPFRTLDLQTGPAGDNGVINGASQTAEYPFDNPNQQANFLLCHESDILGVVSEANWQDVSASHYKTPYSGFQAWRTRGRQLDF